MSKAVKAEHGFAKLLEELKKQVKKLEKRVEFLENYRDGNYRPDREEI